MDGLWAYWIYGDHNSALLLKFPKKCICLMTLTNYHVMFQCNTFLSSTSFCPAVKPQPSITTESTGLFSIKNELSMTLTKEDKDATFYCEVTYFVPGGMRMTETNAVNLTVLCEFH